MKFSGVSKLIASPSLLFRPLTRLIKLGVLLQLVLPLLSLVLCQAQAASETDPHAGGNVPSESRVVIKVGKIQLTQAEFESVLKILEAQQGPAEITRRTFAENYSSLLMLAQQAQAEHLDTSPDVLRQLAIDRNQILSNAAYAKLQDQAKPTADEINSYYLAHGEDFDVVDLRRLFVWQNGTGEKGKRGMTPKQAQALIAAVREDFLKGGDGSKMVQGNKDVLLDSSPNRFQRGELPEKMNEEAFSLQQGHWGVVEQTPDALVLIYVVKRYRQEVKAVSAIIEKKLQNQKLRASMDDLKKSTGIWLDDQYFGAATPPSVSDTQPNASTPTNSVPEEKQKDERQK